MERSRYTVSLKFSNHNIDEVIIDQHYQNNHPEMSDWLILELTKMLNNRNAKLANKNHNYDYYIAEPIYYRDKPYRVIFVLEKGCSYLGIINAFRVKEKKHDFSK